MKKYLLSMIMVFTVVGFTMAQDATYKEPTKNVKKVEVKKHHKHHKKMATANQ
jgi:Ni/Co efflux regulator RcnB